MERWRTRRSFSWGLLLVLCRDAGDLPEFTDAVVSQSPHGLAVKVLHAQDVDLHGFENDQVIPPAEFGVEVLVGDRPPGDVPFSGLIDVPSGVLTLGDAEHQESIEVGAGRWAVYIECSPWEFAESVRLWLQPM